MKKIISVLVILMTAQILFSSGQQEGAASSTHGKYLAGNGIIIPPDDIHVNGYIAQLDYNYRLPETGDFAVYTYNGHNQISNTGQNETLQIGIKANKTPFEDLPPLNLSFVIDKSGSMVSDEKLEWVKESFDIFIQKVRDIDYVSLIVFDNESETVFTSTRMDSQEKRSRFSAAVHSIEAGGGTNLRAGLEDGYTQVMANYRSEYNNRVLFLTDGEGQSEGIIDLAETFYERGINVSTIGVGTNFDVNLMIDLAKAGGGSSRFISDREEMRETFGDELDRMIVPAARNLEIEIEFPEFIELENTWGYRNRETQSGVSYFLPTLHNGDYETILADITIRPNDKTGENTLAKVFVEYDDVQGNHIVLPEITIMSDFIKGPQPVFGISNYTVLKSSTMKLIGERLIEVGQIYYRIKNINDEINSKRYEVFNEKEGIELLTKEEQQKEYDEITSDEISELENSIKNDLEMAINIVTDTKQIVLNSKMKLDNIGFEDELMILDKYIEILGTELELTTEEISKNLAVEPVLPINNDLPLETYVTAMLNELISSITSRDSSIAVSPFNQKGNPESPFSEYLNQSAQMEFVSSGFTVIERDKLNEILDEQKLSLSGLIDTDKALDVGKLLSVDYFITGTIIPTESSVIVFSRLMDVSTSEILSVAQVVIPMSSEIMDLIAN